MYMIVAQRTDICGNKTNINDLDLRIVRFYFLISKFQKKLGLL